MDEHRARQLRKSVSKPLAKDRPHRQLGHRAAFVHRVDFGMCPHNEPQGDRICRIDAGTQVRIVYLNHRFTTEPIACDFALRVALSFQDLSNRILQRNLGDACSFLCRVHDFADSSGERSLIRCIGVGHRHVGITSEHPLCR